MSRLGLTTEIRQVFLEEWGGSEKSLWWDIDSRLYV